MESTITRLLVATKQLLEGLAKWSRGELDENAISEVYVRLGNDFNVASTAFMQEGINMDNLLQIPNELRECLEACLSEEPTQATLERHLPQVRSIVVALLNGLREKQRQFREAANARKVRDIEDRNRSSTRDYSTASTSSRASASASVSGGATLGPGRDSLSSRASREDLRRYPSGRSDAGRTSGGGGGGSLRNPNSSSYPRERGDSRPVSPTTSIPMARPGSSNSMRGQAPPQRAYSTEEGPFSPPATSSATQASVTRQGSLRESGYSARTSGGGDTASELAYQSVPPSRSNGSLSGSVRHSTERTRTSSPPTQPRIADPIPATPPFTSPDPANNAPPTGPPPIPLPVAPDVTSPATDASQTAAQLQSLEALKSSDNLSRRASKRYSAYTMGKMTGGSSTSPGGGREGGRERSGSDLARGIGSGSSAGRELAQGSGEERRGGVPGRREKSALRSSQRGQAPPVPTMPTSISWNERQHITPILEETDSQGNSPAMPPSASFPDGFQSHAPASSPELAALSPAPTGLSRSPSGLPPKAPSPTPPPAEAGQQHKRTPTNASEAESETEAFPISVFLKVGREVKKAKLDERPTIGDLRLLFIERFQYNPGAADFPSINLRDQSFGVEYLLEDINEVKNGSIITLGIDTVDQVKQHIDAGLSNLAQDIRELRTTVTTMRRMSISPGTLLSPDPHTSPILAKASPSERQYHDTAQKVLRMKRAAHSVNDIASIAAGTDVVQPAVEVTSPTSSVSGAAADQKVITTLKTQHEEVQNLRREIGVLRQVYVDFANNTKLLFGELRVQTSRVQTIAATKLSADRSFVSAGISKLESETTDVIVQGDEVQDAIDQMKADFLRGVRITPAQLSETAAKLGLVTRKRKELAEWAAAEKPSWKQLWSTELENVINEEKNVKDQEGLLAELKEDLEEVTVMFKNIQQAAKVKSAAPRAVRDYVPPAPSEDHQGLSTVLLEVKSLNPNPEKRLEAIERAEKERQRKIENQTDEFADELGSFVSGSKLRKSGGFEETERVRQARQDATFKAMFGGA